MMAAFEVAGRRERKLGMALEADMLKASRFVAVEEVEWSVVEGSRKDDDGRSDIFCVIV